MSTPRILVAGIGNIFMGDDAFGSEVARRLIERPLGEGVRVVDFGIRGYDLAYALLEGYDAAILIDAIPRGDRPGSLHLIEPSLEDQAAPETGELPVQGHAMDPVQVLRLARTFGGELPKLLLVGCEPADLGSFEEGKLGLSEPVAAAVDEAVTLVEKLVTDLLNANTSKSS
jgi:hydrogenase maturation protease